MSNQRVVILDGSHSLFETKSSDATTALTIPEPVNDGLGLQPIHHFKDIVSDAVKEVMSSSDKLLGKIAVIDVGIVCEGAVVSVLARELHRRVLAQLTVRGEVV